MTEIKSGRGRVASYEYIAPEERQMFSKGPWKWDEDISGDKIGISDAEEGDVLYVNHSEGVVIPREANAHLIAAAPDLYEALELSLERLIEFNQDCYGIGSTDYRRMGRVVTQAREVLAKARGES